MAYSITLFECNIPEGSNFVIEDIFDYLSGLYYNQAEIISGPKTFELYMDIRVRYPEVDSLVINSPDNEAKHDYAIIQDGAGKRYYYFVEKTERTSNSVATLRLKMDVLNTYFNDPDSDLVSSLISGASRINRRHKDRWRYGEGRNCLYTVFDKYEEGFSPSLKIAEKWHMTPKVYNGRVIGGGTGDTGIKSWKLIYKASDGILYAYFVPYGNSEQEGGEGIKWAGVYVNASDPFPAMTVDPMEYNEVSLYDSEIYKIIDLPVLPFEFPRLASADIVDGVVRLANPTTPYLCYAGVGYEDEDGVSHFYDPKPLLKSGMLKPSTNLLSNGAFCIYSGKTGSGENLVDNLGNYGPFKRELDYDFDIEPYFNTETTGKPSISMKHADAPLDPKLKYGEFANLSFYIDTSAISFNPADFVTDIYVPIHQTPKVTMVLSSLYSGDLYYKVDFPDIDEDIQSSIEVNDPFYFILQNQRDNQEPLISSEYVNYMRNGYNYDQKAKNIATAKSALSTVTSVGTAAAYAATGNMPAALGAGVGVVSSLSSLAFNRIENDLAIERKQAETKAKGANVANVNSQDLFREYNKGNAPVFAWYEIKDYLKRPISDYFFYYGYKDNALLSQYGGWQRFREKELNSRYRFNYVEMDLKVKPGAKTMDADVLADIIRKFKQGVTFIHHDAASGAPVEWDLDQEYENWERSMYA